MDISRQKLSTERLLQPDGRAGLYRESPTGPPIRGGFPKHEVVQGGNKALPVPLQIWVVGTSCCSSCGILTWNRVNKPYFSVSPSSVFENMSWGYQTQESMDCNNSSETWLLIFLPKTHCFGVSNNPVRDTGCSQVPFLCWAPATGSSSPM